MGSQSQTRGRPGRGERHLRRRRLPSRRCTCRSGSCSAAAARPTRSASSPPAAAGTPLHHGPGACIPTPGRWRVRIWRPPASLALWPPHCSSPRRDPSPQSKLEPPGDDSDPDSGGGRRPRAAPVPRVALSWAYAKARIRGAKAPLPGAEVQKLIGQYPHMPPPTQDKQGTVSNLHPINGGTVSSLYPRNGEQGPRETPIALWRGVLSRWKITSHLPHLPGGVAPACPPHRRGKRTGELLCESREPPHNPAPSSPQEKG